MKILITGNLGYVGAALIPYLRGKYPTAVILGYDLGYFQHCWTGIDKTFPESHLDAQYYGDVRNFDSALLKGVDHVIHLAAISNDPIGNTFEDVTLDVNFHSTIDIAKKAIEQGVKSFVFASSCSVYGSAGEEAKTETSSLDPLTAYSRSKVLAETELAKLSTVSTMITCLRFATACGMSDRLRLDLVLNDFVASAFTTKRISIMSDGTPWRPLINVNDMARAIDWAMTRSKSLGGSFLVCNTGSNDWNYTVKDLAEQVQKQLRDVDIVVNKSAPPDKRSYRVNFDLFLSYANGSSPAYTIRKTILDVKEGLEEIGFSDGNFRNSKLMRLNVLNGFLSRKRLDENLRWV